MVVCVRGTCSFVDAYGYFRGTVQLVPSSESAQVIRGSRFLKNIGNYKTTW
jgi:hypothetical protein